MATTFTIGQKVTYKLHTGRTGSGVIDSISNGARGAFYAVKHDDGTILKLRAAQITSAA